MRSALAAPLAAALLLSAPASAQDQSTGQRELNSETIRVVPADQAKPRIFSSGTIEIVQPWVRSSQPGQQVAGGYMTLRNGGPTTVSLVSAETPIAGQVALHRMSFEKGYPEMQSAGDAIEVPPGGEVVFKPGAYHLMFVGLKNPLRAGRTYPLTLHFSDGTTAAIEMITWDAGTVLGQ